MDSRLPANPAAAVSLGGEMGRRFAEFDWDSHALGPRETVSVEAFLRRDAVVITVSDAGRWVGDSSASLRSRRRGRGLTLMSGLADDVETRRTSAGTRVTLRFDHAVAGSSTAS